MDNQPSDNYPNGRPEGTLREQTTPDWQRDQDWQRVTNPADGDLVRDHMRQTFRGRTAFQDQIQEALPQRRPLISIEQHNRIVIVNREARAAVLAEARRSGVACPDCGAELSWVGTSPSVATFDSWGAAECVFCHRRDILERDS